MLAFLSGGCSRQLGYGVLLWSVQDHGLSDGDIVPVHIKSNISRTYVISPMDSEEKLEVPFWQLTTPSSLRSAQRTAALYADYKCQYARVVLDGLPVREEPVNISKQVYRLRKDEVIKVLYKGEGAAVMSGSSAMDGDWLRVLTPDGTQGWCFSYNLRLFDIRDAEPQAAAQTVAEAAADTDAVLERVLSRQWYPESYASMVESHRIDLGQFRLRYGFDTGSASGTVSLKMPGITASFPYGGAEKTGRNTYKLTGTPISMTVRADDFIVVDYTDERGMPASFNLVTLSEPLDGIIAEEQSRRQQLYAQLEAFGPQFESSNYGRLVFPGDGAFTWSGYRQLQPSVIPRSALGRGTISFDLFLSTALQAAYDGAVTFNFDNADGGVTFLYKIEDDGLRLETTGGAAARNGTIRERSSNPVVLFFAKRE